MWKKIVFKVLRSIAIWALNKSFDYVDSDKDGKLSRDEIDAFGRQAYNLGRKIKNRSY